MTRRQTRTGRSDRQWRERQSGRTDTHALAGQSLAEHKRQTGRTGGDCQDRQDGQAGTVKTDRTDRRELSRQTDEEWRDRRTWNARTDNLAGQTDIYGRTVRV